MKFIADIMLGRLAKYLRMTGKDVIYKNNLDDVDILKIAKIENRIILTRDSIMLKRRECVKNTVKSLLIKDDNFIDQLKQVSSELGLDLNPDLIRCIECNMLLKDVKKEKLKGLVPPYVFKTHSLFLFCPGCNKYYWRGTHYINIATVFKKIKKASR